MTEHFKKAKKVAGNIYIALLESSGGRELSPQEIIDHLSRVEGEQRPPGSSISEYPTEPCSMGYFNEVFRSGLMDRATVIYMAECIQNALHRSMAKYPLLACSQTKPNCFPVEAHSWRVKTVAQFSRWRVLPYAMNNVSVENILFLLKYRHIINVWCAETESAGD